MDVKRSIVMFSIFIALWAVYFYNPYSVFEEENKLFFTVATFLFSIYTGFFISRQGKRYSDIRKQIGIYDGELTTIYRVSENFNKETQADVSNIIKKHYNKILVGKQWDYHFLHRTNTLKSIHELYRNVIGEDRLNTIKGQSIRITFNSLRNMQVIRKQLVMLHNERISNFQWLLTALLALMLLISLTLIPSHFSEINSFIKAIASTFVVFMCLLLLELDRLKLFEAIIGENSAKDVIGIIKGKL